mmetsp:Transcript_10006/g.27678  ORF Transcript_10006/g.27678 Transcript_10006/m.27678 type:complete len:298 (+) Transcript_10006:420-1313(+)
MTGRHFHNALVQQRIGFAFDGFGIFLHGKRVDGKAHTGSQLSLAIFAPRKEFAAASLCGSCAGQCQIEGLAHGNVRDMVRIGRQDGHGIQIESIDGFQIAQFSIRPVTRRQHFAVRRQDGHVHFTDAHSLHSTLIFHERFHQLGSQLRFGIAVSQPTHGGEGSAIAKRVEVPVLVRGGREFGSQLDLSNLGVVRQYQRHRRGDGILMSHAQLSILVLTHDKTLTVLEQVGRVGGAANDLRNTVGAAAKRFANQVVFHAKGHVKDLGVLRMRILPNGSSRVGAPEVELCFCRRCCCRR